MVRSLKAFLAAVPAILGCADSGSSKAATAAPMDPVGTWSGTWTSSVTGGSGSIELEVVSWDGDRADGSGFATGLTCITGGELVLFKTGEREVQGQLSPPTDLRFLALVLRESTSGAAMIGHWRIGGGTVCDGDEGSMELTRR